MADLLARALVPSLAVAAALLCFAPGGEAPFSGPKRAVLLAGAVAAVALLPWRRTRSAGLLALPLASAAASALLGPFAAPAATWTALGSAALVLAWGANGLAHRWVVGAAVAAATVVALVALCQSAGLDPFAALGPSAPGERLRVYATLGNPDFVASALAVVLCLALGEAARDPARRPAWLLAAAALAGALAATRSFATAASLGAGLGAVLLHRRRHGAPLPPPALAAAALGLLLVTAPLAGRSLAGALGGRRYLWGVAAPHVLAAPLAGLGPGAVERLWPSWELDWWKARCGDEAACVAARPERRHAGLQDHLHQDALEVLAERGLLGLAAAIATYAVALRRAGARAGPRASALVGALTVSAARANVDFPLARPADLVLLAALVGLSCSPEEP